ncbi:hypothetical protein [Terricaulis sp.]|uniref:hypothetical protein n=1 Tax=Terricaulis sp. TaxID=2768686 RepID=UPI002AC7B1D1|nr:hypothetical protein [Terricaulis sp.]MDZ4690277.1 hypothetical protein [Terricaulis sp.]
MAEIAEHAVAGLATLMLLIGITLIREPHVRALCFQQPAIAAALGFGALTAFMPIIICVAVGSLKRGAQAMPTFIDSDPAPR